jgi:hypothetical protein
VSFPLLLNVFFIITFLNTAYGTIRLFENVFRAGITLIKRTSKESSQDILRVKRDTKNEKCKVLSSLKTSRFIRIV